MADNLYIFAMLLVFIAAFVAVEGVWLWWNSTHGPEVARLGRRLQLIAAAGDAASGEQALLRQRPTAGSALYRQMIRVWSGFEAIERLLIQSGTSWTFTNYAVYSVGLLVSGTVVMRLALYPLAPSLFVGAAVASLPTLHLALRRGRRLRRFEQLLPEALDLIGRALRAGHSLSGALQMAASEMPDPVGEEFRQAVDEINFGISAQEALQNLARRMPSADLGFFVVAVLIQRESGGNLSEILGNISSIVRERLKLFGKVKALSAEGRFSGIVLALLPFVTGFLMYLIDRDFMATLWTDPSGIFFLKAGLLFMVFGGFWMSRTVRIRV